jgi:uncharacterized protein YfaP (DUF2135 family)
MARTRTEVLTYAKPQQVEADGCFAITFIRPTGTNPVMVNGYAIAEGQALQIQQNVGDEDRSTYDIVFTNTTPNKNDLTIIKIMPE